MLVLTEGGASRRTTLLFGAGLVGGPIADQLTRMGACAAPHAFSWSDPEQQTRDLDAILKACDSPDDLQIVWAAGKAGFGATEAQTEAELRVFEAMVQKLAELRRATGAARAGFHLISSAGGLFEGQRLVGPASRPAPMRPYGHLKLAQEGVLEAVEDFDDVGIYRLTSVFGHIRRNQRTGLIAALVLNGLRREVSQITGDMTTLRDYTFTEDIARFVAAQVRGAGGGGRRAMVLASGRPASIGEVIRLVESAIQVKPYVTCRTAAGNSNRSDITFSASLAPSGWRPSDLDTTIRQVCVEVMRSGAWTR